MNNATAHHASTLKIERQAPGRPGGSCAKLQFRGGLWVWIARSSRVRDQVTAGTSALFLLTSDAAIEAVVDALRGTDMRLSATSLADEDAQQLRALLDIE